MSAKFRELGSEVYMAEEEPEVGPAKLTLVVGPLDGGPVSISPERTPYVGLAPVGLAPATHVCAILNVKTKV